MLNLKASDQQRDKLKGYETGGKNVGGKLVVLPHGQPALETYIDDVGVKTIGWGHTGPEVVLGLVWDMAKCEAVFDEDVAVREADLNKDCGDTPTTQNQFDAMLDLAYNIGDAGLAGSTLMKYHVAGHYDLAANQFPLWDKGTIDGKKVVISGLLKRRTDEKLLYLTPDPVAEVTHVEVAVQTPEGVAPATETLVVSDVDQSRRVTPQPPTDVHKMPSVIGAIGALIPAGAVSVQSVQTATDSVRQIQQNASSVQQLAWLTTLLGFIIFALSTYIVLKKLYDRKNGVK